MKETDLVIILTARSGSERLPGKALAEIAGQPLLFWIIQRLRKITPQVVLATTDLAEDQVLEDLGKRLKVPVYRGNKDDVVGRMEKARQAYAKRAGYVLRGLGDCPFMAEDLVQRAVNVMEENQGEAFRWHLAPYCWPVYGAREFPFDREAWDRIYIRAAGSEREHVDSYYMNHIEEFCVVWHEPPSSVYFRPYRLEVDWPEDLGLVRKIADNLGMLAPLPEIIAYLDQHMNIARLNRTRVEKTGPSVYDYNVQRDWMHAMEGKPVVTWSNQIWPAPSPRAQPVFCQTGQDLVGFALNGTLYTRFGKIRGPAFLECGCGSGKFWNSPKGSNGAL